MRARGIQSPCGVWDRAPKNTIEKQSFKEDAPMLTNTRGKRLLRRYPLLANAPEEERPAIVRAALRNPLLLIPFLALGLLFLPLYFDRMFLLLNMDQDMNLSLRIAKFGGMALLPILILVPALTRYVMPYFLRKEMAKRGYSPDPS